MFFTVCVYIGHSIATNCTESPGTTYDSSFCQLSLRLNETFFYYNWDIHGFICTNMNSFNENGSHQNKKWTKYKKNSASVCPEKPF